MHKKENLKNVIMSIDARLHFQVFQNRYVNKHAHALRGENCVRNSEAPAKQRRRDGERILKCRLWIFKIMKAVGHNENFPIF
jgi:hypothetical protein